MTETNKVTLTEEQLLGETFVGLQGVQESLSNINQLIELPNGDKVITNEENATTFHYNTEFNQFGKYSKIRKQLDYNLEYAHDRTLWVAYLMFKYDNETVEYVSSQAYRDKHCITTSGMKTEDLCEIDSLESLLDTFAQYITAKRFNDAEGEVNYNIEKEQKERELMQDKARREYTYSKSRQDDYNKRFTPTDLSYDGTNDEGTISRAMHKLNTNGTASHLSHSDNILKSSESSQKQEKSALFGSKTVENTEKTLKNAENYLRWIYENKLATEIPRFKATTSEFTKRSQFVDHIDTHVDKIDWRNKLITEYKQAIYDVEKSLGYYDTSGLPTSSEYRKEFYSTLYKQHGYKANSLRKLRSEMMSQFKLMFDSLLFVVNASDMSHLYKGDLTLLNMNDVETYKVLLVEYSKLHDSAARDIDTELKWMLWELDDLISRTLKNDTERVIIECLKQGIDHYETADILKSELNYDMTRRNVGMFLTEALPARLLEQHKKDIDDYVYTYRIKGVYKTCKGNGKVYLATERYFRKDSTGKYGVRTTSKEHEASLR